MTFIDPSLPEYERLGLLPLERAIAAFLNDEDPQATVDVRSDSGLGQPLPVSLLFRDPTREDFAWDARVLRLATGRVLDVGAGAGALSLVLQERGCEVTALDVLPSAVSAMTVRGVFDPRLGAIHDFVDEAGFDTVLLLMNGSMLAGSLAGLASFLEKLVSLLRPGGQILMDSTTVKGDGTTPGVRADGRYAGEVQYQLTYRELEGPAVPQLFVDPTTLSTFATRVGLACEVVARGDSGAYLARLTLTPGRHAP